MGEYSASLSSVFVTIMPKPVFTNFQVANESVAYSGAKITITGRPFYPLEETCSATVCLISASDCKVQSPTEISITLSFQNTPGSCQVIVLLKHGGLAQIETASEALLLAPNPTILTSDSASSFAFTLSFRHIPPCFLLSSSLNLQPFYNPPPLPLTPLLPPHPHTVHLSSPFLKFRSF